MLEVFWVRRARSMAFMGGWYAFPGGGLARADAGVELAGGPSGLGVGPPGAGIPERVLDGVGELGPEMAPGLAVCALRELFEETGVLPLSGGPPAGPGGGAAGAAGRRDHLRRGGRRSWRLQIAADRLVYAGRWLTPPLGPLRFDNRFFLLEWDGPLLATGGRGRRGGAGRVGRAAAGPGALAKRASC